MKKFKVVTLGCRTNQYESQGYADQLTQMGYERAQEGEEADLCIVNTCTVTESADSASRHQIRSLLREHPKARVAITGCMVENSAQDLHALDDRISLVPNFSKEKLVEALFPERENLPEFNIQTFEGHTRAFVKVQDGCNSFCTYCIIPYVRGRSRSRPTTEIVKEVEALVTHGYKEVVLTGINIGDFEEGEKKLSDLVCAIDSIEGLRRLRLSSIDPDEVDEKLIEAICSGKTTCPSMHIVLQAGSNAILKRMNRKYTRQIFLKTIQRLKTANPDFTFTTDIIVGFPGESDADFQETLEMMDTVEFAKVHMFPYSQRKRTRAALYPNQVPPSEIQRRKQEVLRRSEKKAFDLRQKFVGRKMEVLIEQNNTGHTGNFLFVHVQGAPLQPHDLVKVHLIENRADGLVGVLV